MTCNKCEGTGWVVDDRGARRCRACAKTEAPGTPLTSEALVGAIRALQVLAFFPTAPEAHTMIGDALGSMCSTVEQVRYVIRRAVGLYQTWDKCGIPGL